MPPHAQFEDVSKTTGFGQFVDEATLARLLANDQLCLPREEVAFEGLVRWLQTPRSERGRPRPGGCCRWCGSR